MSWVWDETLYAGSAAFYATGRMPYSPRIADGLRRALGLDGRGRRLDVSMIAAAAAAGTGAGVPNVGWQQLRAEHLPAGLGTFRVVGFAQSFHWFDRSHVAGSVRQMLEPGGAVVFVQATTHHGVPGEDPRPAPRPPMDEIGVLIRRWLGPVRRPVVAVCRRGRPGVRRRSCGRPASPARITSRSPAIRC